MKINNRVISTGYVKVREYNKKRHYAEVIIQNKVLRSHIGKKVFVVILEQEIKLGKES